eukprot:6373805-Amphidinium_carterae.1
MATSTSTRRSRRSHEEADKQIMVYKEEMQKNVYLWLQLNTQYGELDNNPDYINAFNDKDNEKMKEVCYKYFEKLKDIHDEWREQQIEEDEKKLEAKNKRAEEQRQAEKRKQDEEAQRHTETTTAKAKPTTARSTSESAAASTTPARSTTPTRPTRPVPVPKGEQAQLEDALRGKSTPITPS